MWNYLIIVLSAASLLCCTMPSTSKQGRSDTLSSKQTRMDTLIFTNCPDKVTVQVGASLILKLPATQGTAYVWQAKPMKYLVLETPDLIEYEEQPIKEGETRMVGRASLQVLRFKAVGTGKERIDLFYAAPFNPGDIAKTCTFQVQVP